MKIDELIYILGNLHKILLHRNEMNKLGYNITNLNETSLNITQSLVEIIILCIVMKLTQTAINLRYTFIQQTLPLFKTYHQYHLTQMVK